VKNILLNLVEQMSKGTIKYLIVGLFFIASLLGCAKKRSFSYEILDLAKGEPEELVVGMPFAENFKLFGDSTNSIKYDVKDGKIVTSVYIFANAGSCTGNRIERSVEYRKDTLLLSYNIKYYGSGESCSLTNFIKLNYEVNKHQTTHVAFRHPSN
jgi:hypothetical protein